MKKVCFFILTTVKNNLCICFTAECLSEVELSQYLLVASSCVVGGGSHNEEVALEILQKHEGNVQHALQELLSSYDIHTSCLYGNEDALSLFSSQEGSDSEDDLSSGSLQPPHPDGGLDNGTQQCNLNVNLKRGCHSHGHQLHTVSIFRFSLWFSILHESQL